MWLVPANPVAQELVSYHVDFYLLYSTVMGEEVRTQTRFPEAWVRGSLSTPGINWLVLGCCFYKQLAPSRFGIHPFRNRWFPFHSQVHSLPQASG